MGRVRIREDKMAARDLLSLAEDRVTTSTLGPSRLASPAGARDGSS